MNRTRAHAKINLALLVGPSRADGMHELATVLQRVDLHDEIALEPAEELLVTGFPEDTLVTAALSSLAAGAGAVRAAGDTLLVPRQVSPHCWMFQGEAGVASAAMLNAVKARKRFILISCPIN